MAKPVWPWVGSYFCDCMLVALLAEGMPHVSEAVSVRGGVGMCVGC